MRAAVVTMTRTSPKRLSAVCGDCDQDWDGDDAHANAGAHCRSLGHAVYLRTVVREVIDTRTTKERKAEHRSNKALEAVKRGAAKARGAIDLP